MTSEPESTLFDFAASNRAPTNEEEKIVTDIHAALGTTGVPLRLRRPPAITNKPRWRRNVYAAAALALAVAVVFDGLFTTRQDSTPTPTEVPEVVLGLAGQESPAAANESCDLGASIPIIQGVSTSPLEGAALLLTPEGDLIMDCADAQRVLATGIQEVTPQSWPGVISIWDGVTVTYLNIATGDTYKSEDLTHINSQRNIGPITARSTNQLIIVPATGSPTDTAILDLATLEEEQFFDRNDNPIPITNISAGTSNERGDCVVLAYSQHNTRMNSDYLGGFVVYDANNETNVVDSVSPQMPVPREIATSPNCDQIASASFQGQQMEGTTTLTIQDVDGGESATIQLETGDLLTELLWLKSGDGIVFASGESLLLWEAPFNQSEPTLLHEGVVFDDISHTHDPNIITATGMMYGGGPEATPQRTLIINLASGEVTEIEGEYLLRQRRLQPQEHNVLPAQETHSTVYTAVSGEQLGQMEGDIEFDSSFIQVPIHQTSSAEVGIIGTNPEDLWRVLDSDGNPMMERIDPPAHADFQGHPMISMSHDGWMFISQGWDSQTGWMKDLDDPNADWIEITFESDVNTVQFLNTQGLTVSPNSTPQASPIANVMREPHESLPGFGATERDMPVLVTYAESLSESGDWYPFNPGSSWYQIRFDDEREFAELEVRNGAEIRQASYPNIFLAYVPGGVHVVNISSLSAITIQTDVSADRLDDTNAPLSGTQWLVIPDTSLVVNMQSMSVVALNEVLGVTSDRFYLHMASTNDTGSELLVAIDVIDDPENQWRLARLGSDGSAETIPLEDPMSQPLGLALSPDGESAIVRSSRVEDNKSVDVFTVIELSTGEVTSRYEHPGDLRTSDPVWVDEDSAFVFSNHGVLYRADLDDPDPNPLYEAKGTQLTIYKTSDQDTVVLVQNLSYTSPDPVELDDPNQVIVVNTDTGESIVHQGSDQTMSPDPVTTYTRNAAMVEENPAISTVHELDVTVIDTTTGEEVGSIEQSGRDTARPGPVKSAWGTASGDIQFVTWGSQHTYMIIDDDGAAMLERITPPPGPASENDLGVTIRSSDDSSWLAMHIEAVGEWWIADLSGDEPEWEQLPNFQQIIFVAAREEQLATSPSATPAASPVAAEACDLTGDIPLLAGVNESQLDRTSVIVTLNQELKVVCEAQETVLAENVQIASPTQTPYVLLLMTQTGPMLLNVKTGESLHIQQPPIVPQQTIGMQTWDGWAMLPSTENPEGISLYLLDSFVEIPVMIGDNPIGVESIGGIAVGANDDVVALTITEDGNGNSTTVSRLFIANLDGSSHTVEIPEFDSQMQMVISPDGSTVAIVSFEGEQHGGAKRISLLDTADGSLINERQIGNDPRFIDINWLNDGSALLYTNDTGLHMLTEPDGEPTTILEGDNVQGLTLSHDNNVVAIGHREALDGGGFQPVTTIINLETGNQHELVGRDLWSGSSMATRRSTLVLSDQYLVPNSDPTVYTVYDAVTGEALGEIEHIKQEQSFSHTSWGYNRDINVVAFGLDSVWMLTDEHGDPTLIPVPSPAIETDSAGVPVQITLSPQGITTLRTYEPNTSWILFPNEKDWIEVKLPGPSESQGVNANIGIIPGSG